MTDTPVTLAGIDQPIAPLGVGCWAWGDSATWGMDSYDQSITESTIADAWNASIDAGVTFFDTAEVYGGGESERIIGRLLQNDPARAAAARITTKFMPAPWKLNVTDALRASLEASLERMGLERVELYQIHGPISLRSHAALAEALAAVYDDGLIGAVGVSNYSAKEMRGAHAALDVRGVPLATNQIEFSLLRNTPLTGGLLDECDRLGVTALAYSPIGQGRLGGKYSATNPPPGSRTFSDHPMTTVDRVLEVVRSIGESRGGKTPAQVALRWIIQHGAVPIPGAKNGDQAAQNAGAVGWSLTEHDMDALDAVALGGKFSLKNKIWQHG